MHGVHGDKGPVWNAGERNTQMSELTPEVEQVLALLGWDVEQVASIKIEVTRASQFAPNGASDYTECWKHTVRNITEIECVHDVTPGTEQHRVRR